MRSSAVVASLFLASFALPCQTIAQAKCGVAGIVLDAVTGEAIRKAQVVVDLYGNTQLPMILAGDFNSRPASAVMELVEGHWVNTDKV